MSVTIWIVGLITLIILAGIAGLFLWGLKNSHERQKEMNGLVHNFQNDLGGLRQNINDQILDLSRQMNTHQQFNSQLLQDTHKDYRTAIGQVNTRLGELGHATQSMVEIGKDISSLQDILSSPKLRGGLGELFLADLLEQILPREHFQLQYAFRAGTTVDAIIRLGEGIIPVDAKFPLENFRKMLEADTEEAMKPMRKAFYSDVKKHIDVIASKYILPEEGTMDFAIMYMPAENVYYEAVIKQDSQKESLSEYAMKKKIIPVSPNSFYAYLQAIVRGLKGLRIEKSAQKILENLGRLEADLNRVATDFEKVGGHLSNAQAAYERTNRSFDKMRLKLAELEGSEKNEKTLEVEQEASS